MLPISMAPTGEVLTIKKITGTDKTKQHLAELGFVVNAKVVVVNSVSSDLILQIHESRIAINQTMANRIFV